MVGGMHVCQGACMAGVCVRQGVCMTGGMHGRGVCVARGVHGRGHAWQGGHAWQVSACVTGGRAWQERWPLQWAVRILLECTLVKECR